MKKNLLYIQIDWYDNMHIISLKKPAGPKPRRFHHITQNKQHQQQHTAGTAVKGDVRKMR